MSLGLAIDPGLSSGMCLFRWDYRTPFMRQRVWQFGNGAQGLSLMLDTLRIHTDGYRVFVGDEELDALVVEKFTPRPHESFALTQKAVEPLRGEGVLIGRGFDPFIQWREPSQQYFMGGGDLADKKKRSREFLKLHGLHLTGSMVGQKDADDAISATLHAISWMRKIKHMPTLEDLFMPKETE